MGFELIELNLILGWDIVEGVYVLVFLGLFVVLLGIVLILVGSVSIKLFLVVSFFVVRFFI